MRPYTTPLAIALILSGCSGAGGDSSGNDSSANSATAHSAGEKVAEVSVMELKPSVFSHEIVCNGRLEARECVDVNFQSPAIIAAVFVKNGQYVAKGQKIAVADTYKIGNQLEKDRNTVASATLEMQDVLIGQGYDPEHPENVPADVMRLARLRSGLEQAELALKTTRRELDDATLTAPISGVVANLRAKAHNMSSASEPVCRIIGRDDMQVEFDVLESELPLVRTGDAVSVAPFSGGQTHRGRVEEINPMVDGNGMVKVWASVAGGDGLIDGMNVRVSVAREVGDALVVPKSAVVLRSGRQVVFTLENGKACWNYVTTGLENLSQYTVTDGLHPGQTVITSGNINLAHESPVKKIEN